jgi:hypothetical protein
MIVNVLLKEDCLVLGTSGLGKRGKERVMGGDIVGVHKIYEKSIMKHTKTI